MKIPGENSIGRLMSIAERSDGKAVRAAEKKGSGFSVLLESALHSRRREASGSSGHSSMMQMVAILQRQIDDHFSYLFRRACGRIPLSSGEMPPDVDQPRGTVSSKNQQMVSMEPDPVTAKEPSADIDGIIAEVSTKFEVEENLVKAVIKTESDFQANSISSKGAMGLMQLMPGTANDMGVNDPYDPRDNVTGGVKYLKMLLDRYDGNVDQALAAYNWGMGNLQRSTGGMPEETRNYVAKVKAHYKTLNAVNV